MIYYILQVTLFVLLIVFAIEVRDLITQTVNDSISPSLWNKAKIGIDYT